MLFQYKAIDKQGNPRAGSIDALSVDYAIASLHHRGFIITQIAAEREKGSLLGRNITFFERVGGRDIVILSRQMATLFEAQVSALRIFRLLAAEAEREALRRILTEMADDIQGGASISKALSRHRRVFSEFYVNMVRSGEETGKLNETFTFLADHLDRTYEVNLKVRNSLIYPIFVVIVFIAVMVLMLTQVIPKVSVILREFGQGLPIYTKIVIGLSDFFVDFGPALLALLIVGLYLFWRYVGTAVGRLWFDELKINLPLFGPLLRKLYLSRVADNLSTQLTSGIPIARAIEITAAVTGNMIFYRAMNSAGAAITSGAPISDAFSHEEVIPGVMVQMIKVGEESGELGSILKTLAKFYNREVTQAVDTLVDLIEPILIIVLALGVALLLAAVILPIYNFSSAIQ
ncbi:MAG: type II secretion system F family protein [Candidatus Taylorbacteria bacterium]|nr:type II secretion system F family protein [Candidatus Taylorbacteria bacterium]